MRRLPVLLALVFATAYTQPPEFYSNQHQYFLHGLVQAGYGNLTDDWLANTADPTPVFSAAIALGYRLGKWTFQAVHFAAIAVYFLSIWKLVAAVGLIPRTIAGKLLFAGLFTLSHSAILRVASDRLFGADYPWFVQAGLANQYLLGAGLQPSVVGILLVTSLAAYASGRPVLACGLAAAVNAVHATYLLPSAMLVAGMLAGELRAERKSSALRAGFVSLVIAIPIVIYQFYTFGPTSAAFFAEATRIIAAERIPHHARPVRWFDAAAAFQIGWILFGIFMLRRTRLSLPLTIAAALGLIGTAAVIATNNSTLALLFPWRVSAVLVPVATAAILAKAASGIDRSVQEKLMAACGIALLGAGLAGAVAVYALHLGYREPAGQDEVLGYVRQSKQKGDVYLTPSRFAKPTTERGVYSFTFIPPKDSSATVSFELSSFRLDTGAAQYVDFKAIPYKDTDVLEWHRRVSNCVKWFGEKDWDAAGTIAEIRREGISHIVVPAVTKLNSRYLEVVTQAGDYRIYRVRPTTD